MKQNDYWLSRTIVCNNSKMHVITIIIAKDLSFSHKAQKEFIQAEKLESYEIIVRGIFHGFKAVSLSNQGVMQV
jgi:hypothetical protein